MSEVDKMFERATREQIRFAYKGQSSVEDLWQLSLPVLNDIFMSLNTQLKQVANEESLLETNQTSEDETLALKVGIVRYIFATKKAGQEARKNAKEKAAQKQRLLDLIAEKQDQAMASKSIEELTAMVNAL